MFAKLDGPMPSAHRLIVCVLIPRFALRVALGDGMRLPPEPVAVGPDPGGPPAIGECNAAAAAFGVAAGMRAAEALARCPSLRLEAADPGGVAEAGERLLAGLEDLGAAVEPLEPGLVLFSGDGLVRMYGGPLRLLHATARQTGTGGRVGAGPGRFLARAAAERARPGRPFLVEHGAAADFLAPLPVDRLGLDARTTAQLGELGVATVGALAALPLPAVADRFGTAGASAWRLATGSDATHVQPRLPAEPLREAIAFPEPVGDEVTLRGALVALVERVLARPERDGRPVRTLAVSAGLAGGGSWRRPVALRDPTADPRRLRDAVCPRLVELPAAIDRIELELTGLAEIPDRQLSLVRPASELLRERAAEAARQVRAGVGEGHLWRVVEVAPWSRVPEGRDLLVPFDG